ncbi:UbiA prenyltransferase [Nitritalea halalkaliphila LW7]|uniref:UbiA prenyltransferase n=1 Tax=Nitritalea halalkaliphila LW7 TaxID=1189621 RepID=I5BZP1_9BACT|nr:UbiA prenyltransferase [Nitritalea halalkaliphila]EIM75043.1 UbiA prenyltransferase [Nitritalea halalkaliphila LW7]
MAFFSALLEVAIPPIYFFLLGLFVWCIYTLDHLLDAKKIKEQAISSKRRAFYQRYTKPLFFGLLTAAGLLALLCIVYTLPVKLLLSAGLGGLAVLLLIFAYSLSPNLLPHWKEALVALLYVAGIAWVPTYYALEVKPLSFRSSFELAPIGVLFLLYGNLSYTNLLQLAYQDREDDRQFGFSSAVKPLGAAKLKNRIYALHAIGLSFGLCGLFYFPSFYGPFFLVVVLMQGIHAQVFRQPRLSAPQQRMRTEASFSLSWLVSLLR